MEVYKNQERSGDGGHRTICLLLLVKGEVWSMKLMSQNKQKGETS